MRLLRAIFFICRWLLIISPMIVAVVITIAMVQIGVEDLTSNKPMIDDNRLLWMPLMVVGCILVFAAVKNLDQRAFGPLYPGD